MPGDRRKSGEGKVKDLAYGEAVRTGEERPKGAITSEKAAREESEREEGRIASADALKTDEERIAERQGKAGPGDLTDHVDESERRRGEEKAEQAAETRRAPGQGEE